MKPVHPRKNLLTFLEPFISTLFWLLLFLSPLLFGNFEEGIAWTHVLNTWKSFIPYLFLFMLNRLVFIPFLFFRNRRWLFFIANLAMILVMAVGVHYYRTQILMPAMQGNRQETMAPPPGAPPPHFENPPPHMGERGIPPPQQPPKQLPPFMSFLVVSVLVVGFDTGLMLSVKWVQSEQRRVRAEKENVESQLAFLQNQVSPHFFMNTLNNIHALIDINTTKAKESIIQLSALMRHLLYDSRVEEIPLKKEIEFIRNYVELMRLRYSEKVRIDLHIPDQVPEKKIPPLLFTSFVENAFKHGISYQETSFIDIALSFGQDRLSFAIKNSKPRTNKEEGPPGIGIENSRKRLDLIYGDRYALDIDEGNDEFKVSLNIPV